MDALVALPGVGRKTANVILGNAFGRNDGVVVDTHVGRVAHRLGLTSHTDPVNIERDLMKLIAQDRLDDAVASADRARTSDLCRAPPKV